MTGKRVKYRFMTYGVLCFHCFIENSLKLMVSVKFQRLWIKLLTVIFLSIIFIDVQIAGGHYFINILACSIV